MNDKKRFSSTTLLTGTALMFGLMMTQSASAQPTLTEDTSFGSNPGNLTMYTYSGSGSTDSSPIVVAMHGCLQDADEYVSDTGLFDLADLHDFHLVVPEQKDGFFGNHASRCFNWFQSGDAENGSGEAESIAQMVSNFKGSNRTGTVYASGFSAGGGMAAVMLAAYGDVFKGAVIHAGIPYRCALTVALSFPCMGTPGFLEVNKTASQWGTLLTQSGGPTTYWSGQTLALYHSNDDTTVKHSRMEELREQWTNKSASVTKHTLATDIGHKVSISGSNCGSSGTYTANGGVCAQSEGLHAIGVWL